MSAAPSTPPSVPRSYINLTPGDPAPWVTQWIEGNESYALQRAGGRYSVLCFFASAANEASQAAMKAVAARPELFDGEKVSFFGVSLDKADQAAGRLPDSPRWYRDFDGTVSRAFGALPHDFTANDMNVPARRFWMVLDPMLRVMKVIPFAADGSDRDEIIAAVEVLPPVERHAGIELQAPVLMLPNVFEPEFCRTLIAFYEAQGGNESGFMREVAGKTVLVHDPEHKRRRDCLIEDMSLIDAAKARIMRRIVPEIAKAYQFQVTRIERFVVARYSAEEEGHFNPHRDNTTKATAHRRFAVSLNLNDDYEGGELSFPEYGTRLFRPPAGAACVFSCSLLHQASLVTRGRRFVFLPFLYDEAGAALREQNNKFLDSSIGQYQAG
jgi:predicted 2-oxoglutarate/Fe(II)-dependent dioxygenase YbiX/peroxiredoxin